MFGFVGILLASPLVTTAMILGWMLYIEEHLGNWGMRQGDDAEP